jgi:hypothetical protein
MPPDPASITQRHLVMSKERATETSACKPREPYLMCAE